MKFELVYTDGYGHYSNLDKYILLILFVLFLYLTIRFISVFIQVKSKKIVKLHSNRYITLSIAFGNLRFTIFYI